MRPEIARSEAGYGEVVGGVSQLGRRRWVGWGAIAVLLAMAAYLASLALTPDYTMFSDGTVNHSLVGESIDGRRVLEADCRSVGDQPGQSPFLCAVTFTLHRAPGSIRATFDERTRNWSFVLEH